MYRPGFRLFVGTSALLTLFIATGCIPASEPEPSPLPVLRQQEARQSTATGTMVGSGYGFTTTRLADGRILVVGGQQRSSVAELYDPATGTFSATTPVPDGGRTLHVAVLLNDGQVLITGNTDPATAVNALRHDPRTAAWNITSPMVTPRINHGAVVLPDGRVLVTGGSNYATNVDFASCELFDPTANTWRSVAPMNRARKNHSTLVLANGKVLVSGGEPTGTAELYDPATNTWTLTGSPALARRGPTSLLLPNGKVLVVSGMDAQTGSHIIRAELYDPATGTWTAAGSMKQARQEPAAVLLSNRQVLFFGGQYMSTPLSSVERYNSLTNTWDQVEPMLSARYQGGAALLSNDQILLMSGLSAGNLAEIYTDTTPCRRLSCLYQGKCGVVHDGCGGLVACESTCGTSSCTDNNTCVSLSPQAEGLPLYDSILQVPRCSQLGAKCGSRDLLKGRAGLGPENHAPNTLVNSRCADGQEGTYQTDTSLESLTVSALTGSLTASKEARVQVQVYASADYLTNALDLYAASDASAPVWTFIATLVPTGPGSRLLETTYTLPVGSAYQALRGVFRVGGTASPCGQGATTDTDDLVFPVNPPPPPTVELKAPLANAYVQGQVLVQANATSTTGITRVEFYANDSRFCTDSNAPYACNWDTLPLTNGTFTLKAYAYNPQGSGSVSPVVSVKVANDRLSPTATVTGPTPGQRVRGNIYLMATLSDDVALRRGELYLDDVLFQSADYSGYSTSLSLYTLWNSTLVSDGPHSLFARVADGTGKTGESARVGFIVDNTYPTATLTSPADGTEVVGPLQVTAEASDLQGVQSVALLVNGAVLSTKTAAPYTFDWNSALYTSGAYTLAIRATDTAGNQTTTPAVNLTVNNPPAGLAAYDMARKAPGCMWSGPSCDSGGLLDGRGLLGPEPHAPNTLAGTCQDVSTGTYHVSESLDRLKVSTVDGNPLASGKTVRIEATVWASGTGSYDSLDLFYAANANSPTWTYLTTLSAGGGGQRVLSTTYTLPTGSLQAVRGVFRYLSSRSVCTSGGSRDHDDLFFVTQ